MDRIVMPELLDELAPEDPQAVHSRRDLVRVNAWMGNVSKISQMLREMKIGSPGNIIELGAGDGKTTLKIAALTGWKDVKLTMVDQQDLLSPSTREAFDKLGWKVSVAKTDVRDFLSARPKTDLIITNLFLHHFDQARLVPLLNLVAECDAPFVACEPLRDPLALMATRLLWVIGCNHVTRNDAYVSVKAGFREKELTSNWHSDSPWKIAEKRSGLFSHMFLAQPLRK